ncbi:MAG: Mini-ribonuclease 3 [Bacilli bacterium]
MNHSNLVLAFIGDSVFELKIREYFINSNLCKVDQLTKQCARYASAKGHFIIMQYLLDNECLLEEEVIIYKKGRNAKVNQRRKNFNSEHYHASTGFEALIGYLYLTKQDQRIDRIIEIIIEEVKL